MKHADVAGKVGGWSWDGLGKVGGWDGAKKTSRGWKGGS